MKHNNLTTFPEGIKTEEGFQEFVMYENTEFRAEQNYQECWSDVNRLKAKFNEEVYLVSLNEGSIDNKDEPKPLRRESQEKKRYTFAFDYAITKLSKDDLLWLHYYIMKYRNTMIDDPRTKLAWNIRASISLARVELEIKEHPHIVGHFS